MNLMNYQHETLNTRGKLTGQDRDTLEKDAVGRFWAAQDKVNYVYGAGGGWQERRAADRGGVRICLAWPQKGSGYGIISKSRKGTSG